MTEERQPNTEEKGKRCGFVWPGFLRSEHTCGRLDHHSGDHHCGCGSSRSQPIPEDACEYCGGNGGHAEGCHRIPRPQPNTELWTKAREKFKCKMCAGSGRVMIDWNNAGGTCGECLGYGVSIELDDAIAFAASIQEDAQQQIEELKKTAAENLSHFQLFHDEVHKFLTDCGIPDMEPSVEPGRFVFLSVERRLELLSERAESAEKQLAEARIELEAAEQRGDEYKAALTEARAQAERISKAFQELGKAWEIDPMEDRYREADNELDDAITAMVAHIAELEQERDEAIQRACHHFPMERALAAEKRAEAAEKQLAEARAQAFREVLQLLVYIRDQEDEGLESLRQKLEARVAIERGGEKPHGNS